MPYPLSNQETILRFQGQIVPLEIVKNRNEKTTMVTAHVTLNGKPLKVTLSLNTASLSTKSIKSRMERELIKTEALSEACKLGGTNLSLSINRKGDIKTYDREGKKEVHKRLALQILGEKPSTKVKSLRIEIDSEEMPGAQEAIEGYEDLPKAGSSHGEPPGIPMPVNDKPFTKDELKELQRLTPLLKSLKTNHPLPLSKHDKAELAFFFAKAIGNRTLVKQTADLVKDKKIPEDFKETLLMVQDIAFRTRDLRSPLDTVRKIEGLIRKIHAHEAIHERDKLSLQEIGGIEMFLKLEEELRLFERIGLPDAYPLFRELSETFSRGSLVLEQISVKLDKYSNYKSGDLAFIDNNKYRHFRGERVLKKEQLKTRVLKTPLHHAAVIMKGVKNPETNYAPDELSHIIQGHVRDNFNLRNKCIYSVYRLNPETLLTKDESVRELLSEMYAEEGLSEGLSRDYQEIQGRLHDNLEEKFKSIDNPMNRRLKSGLAEIFTSMHSKNADPGRFKKLHQQFFSEDADFSESKMVCSEFAAKTLLAGLIEEQELLKSKMISFLMAKKGYTQDEANEAIQNLELFSLPVPPSEKFSRINPTRLLKLLTDHGSVMRVEHQPLIQMLVRKSDLATDPREEIFPAAKTTGFRADEAHLARMVPFNPSDLKEVEEEAPNTPPDNPCIIDKLMNIDGEMTKNRFKIRERRGKQYEEIKMRRQEIKGLKEEWREKIPLASDVETLWRVDELESEGELKALLGGMGGAYLLSDKEGNPVYILKPSDEDLMALNNRKCKATLAGTKSKNASDRVRAGIPLYRTVQTEVLAYQIAKDLGLGHITPHTAMVIFRNEHFHDIMDNVEELKGDDREKILQAVGGGPDKEKFCSVQEFVPNSIELLDYLSALQSRSAEEDLTAHQQGDILSRCINPGDFENCFLYACVVGETDGNCGNYRLQPDGVNERGETKYRMIKVDNALTFSENNSEFDIFLNEFPQAMQGISQQGRDFLHSLTDEKIAAMEEKMVFFGLGKSAVKAFRTRIHILRECATIPEITLKEISEAIIASKIPKNTGPVDDGGLKKFARMREQVALKPQELPSDERMPRLEENAPFQRQETAFILELPSQRNLHQKREIERMDTTIIHEGQSERGLPSHREIERMDTTIIHEETSKKGLPSHREIERMDTTIIHEEPSERGAPESDGRKRE